MPAFYKYFSPGFQTQRMRGPFRDSGSAVAKIFKIIVQFSSLAKIIKQMPDVNDMALLREYVGSGSDSAFAEIVHRHINLVYSVALRFTDNGEDAQDVTQAVFVILARKAARLRPKTVLTGWLYETTRFTAMNFLTRQSRRQAREQDAYMQSTLNNAETEGVWRQLAPLLEDAMSRLSEKERTLVALRFFENKSAAETAALTGMNEWAARKRVERTLEKLRAYFSKRGIPSTAVTIAAAISANSVHAAPAALAQTATAVALAKGATASASTLTLAKGALKVMAWTHAQTAAVIGTVVLFAAGTAALVAQHEHQAAATIHLRKSSWVFAGYGSPEATMQTTLWAVSQLNGKAVLDGISADCQEDFREYLAQNKPGMSVDAFLLQKWTPPKGGISDMRLEKEEVLSTNQVLVQYSIRAGSQSTSGWLKFKKFGDNWEIDDFDPKGPNGRTGLEHSNAQYGGIGVAIGVKPGDSHPQITKVLPSLALSQTNLVPGLMLLKVNGTSTTGKGPGECIFLTRGRVGTDVVLELYDPDRRQTNTVELTRTHLSGADSITLGWMR